MKYPKQLILNLSDESYDKLEKYLSTQPRHVSRQDVIRNAIDRFLNEKNAIVCDKSHVPNEKTIASFKEIRNGDYASFSDVDSLMNDLLHSERPNFHYFDNPETFEKCKKLFDDSNKKEEK